MNGFSQIIAALTMGGLAVYFIFQVKRQPQLFEKNKIIKSLHTMGIMALILIAFIWLCITFLRG